MLSLTVGVHSIHFQVAPDMDLISLLHQHVPKWSVLRAVGNSTPVKMTIIIPLIGYLVIFNEYLVAYLHLSREIEPAATSQLSNRLIILYLGLCALAAASVLYSWRCPEEIKHHPTSAAYVGGDGASVGEYRLADIEEKLRRGAWFEPYKEIRDRFDVSPETMRFTDPADLRERQKEARTAILHLYFAQLNDLHLPTRLLASFLFLIGFSCLLFLATPIFVRVVTIAVQRAM